MLRTRVIPALLLRNESLVKTVRFGRFTYVGDPCNTVRIFNELEVDELLFLDITATSERRAPNIELLKDIANECFMPLGYGGGIRSLEQAKAIFDAGFEKVVINTYASERPEFITELSNHYGSQAVIGSIDVAGGLLRQQRVVVRSGSKRTALEPAEWARRLESLGAGEILLTSVDREGSWSGFDMKLVKEVSDAVDVPVIAHGGARSLADIGAVVNESGASAVALGSMVVFQKKGMGVLVNFPDREQLEQALKNGVAIPGGAS
jgi:imidazole glycerol-phosphate synthase subunit HisF